MKFQKESTHRFLFRSCLLCTTPPLPHRRHLGARRPRALSCPRDPSQAPLERRLPARGQECENSMKKIMNTDIRKDIDIVINPPLLGIRTFCDVGALPPVLAILGVVPRALPALVSPAVTAAESRPSAARAISRHGSARVTLLPRI
jgi:hypothetical protein